MLTETIEINKKSQFLYENDKSLWSDNLHKYFLMWILKPKEFETEKQLRSQFINLFDILPCFHGKLTKKYLHWKRQNDVNPQMNKTPKPNIKKKKKKSIKEETRIMRIMRELREPKPRDTKDRKTDLLS